MCLIKVRAYTNSVVLVGMFHHLWAMCDANELGSVLGSIFIGRALALTLSYNAIEVHGQADLSIFIPPC